MPLCPRLGARYVGNFCCFPAICTPRCVAFTVTSYVYDGPVTRQLRSQANQSSELIFPSFLPKDGRIQKKEGTPRWPKIGSKVTQDPNFEPFLSHSGLGPQESLLGHFNYFCVSDNFLCSKEHVSFSSVSVIWGNQFENKLKL